MRPLYIVLATVVFAHVMVAQAHVVADASPGKDAVDRAAQESDAVDPLTLLPGPMQQEVRLDIESRRNAVDRLMLVLSVSDAQRKAIMAEHEQLIEQYIAGLPTIAAEADTSLDELIARVPETQPFKKRAAGEALTSREQMQIRRFLIAREVGAKANALMGTELAEEARAIDNDMREQMRAAWRQRFDLFLGNAQGVLTDEQAERVYAAVHAYECQPYRSGPERAAGSPSNMLGGGAAK